MSNAGDNGLPSLTRVPVWLNDPANWTGQGGALQRIIEHLVYTGVLVAAAAAIAVPIGIAIGHTGRGRTVIAGLANAIRAIPSLGLLVFLIIVLAPRIGLSSPIGSLVPAGGLPYFVPAFIVLVALAIPPILNQTYAGVQTADAAAKDAATAMGMTAMQVVRTVELPAAVPQIFSGLRIATLQVIASLTVAAYAPLVGGLGRLIVDGDQNLADPRYGYPAMISGGLLIAVLAILVDAALIGLQHLVTSPGLAPARDRSWRRRSSLHPTISNRSIP